MPLRYRSHDLSIRPPLARPRLSPRARPPVLAALAILAPYAAAHAQTTRVLSACTTGTLSNCAEFRLTATPGAGAGGQTLFEIAIRNTGSRTNPALATSIYNVVFGTGQNPFAPGSEVDAAAAPVARGGATVTSASPWDVFDSGDAVFLSALDNFGVGGCVVGTPVGGFGQAGNTCAGGAYLAFSYSTPRAYDLSAFSLLDVEVVGLTPGLPADSYTPSAVPEPGAALLLAPGLLGAAAMRRRAVRADAAGAAVEG